MIDYMKGLIFIPLFIYLLSSFGRKIKKSDSFSENFIYGFVFYTCLQFFGGFVAQCFHLPWIIYKLYMIILLLLMIIFSFYKKERLSKEAVIQHFRHYWVLYALAIVFVGLSFLNLQYQWNANLVDDGYYLLKIRMAPYVPDYADYNFAVGYPAEGSIIRNINTFEIEAAFYANLFHMDTSVFVKVFMSFFNYTLIMHTIYWFYKTLLSKHETKRMIIAIIPILFFGIYQELMVNYHVLYLQDSWHFNTAIWYGSALVRCMGLLLLVTPFIEDQSLSFEKIVFFSCSVVALFSKASQALPLVYIVTLSYLFFYMFKHINNKKTLIIGYLVVLIVMSLLPMSDEIIARNSVVMQQFGNNSGTLIIKISYFLIIISYLFDITSIRKWNNWLILIGCSMFIPKINTLFLYFSVYDFVAARTVSLFFFALIITAFLYGFLLLSYVIINIKEMVLLYSGVAIALVAIPLISIQRNLGLINTINTIADNSTLQPGSTLELGASLEEISKASDKELNVLMPMWVVINGTPHPVATMVRYNAMNIHSIGTVPRYGSLLEDNPYYTYTDDVHVNFERWHSGMNTDQKAMHNLLNTYQEINCIVVYFDDAKDRLEAEFGYHVADKILLEDHVHYYYVMIKD